MNYKLAVFDMDGTVLNTLDDLCGSLNYALQVCGYQKRTLSEVRSFVGNGIRKLVERGVPDGTAERETDIVMSEFTKHYKAHCYDKTKPYDGVISMLARLRDAGCRTACVSNKDDYAVKLLTERFFDGMFDISVGSREEIRKKPAPDTVNEVLNTLAIDRRDAVYIGDSEVDIETAKNAGTDCITVLWGFRDRGYLIERGAEVTAETPDDVEKMILGV